MATSSTIERQELIIQVRNAMERRKLVIENREYTHRLEGKVREQTHTIRVAHEETIHRLVTASMFRDEETGAHIRRVGMYSALMAEALDGRGRRWSAFVWPLRCTTSGRSASQTRSCKSPER